jgi:hypothetical protein
MLELVKLKEDGCDCILVVVRRRTHAADGADAGEEDTDDTDDAVMAVW